MRFSFFPGVPPAAATTDATGVKPGGVDTVDVPASRIVVVSVDAVDVKVDTVVVIEVVKKVLVVRKVSVSWSRVVVNVVVS